MTLGAKFGMDFKPVAKRQYNVLILHDGVDGVVL